MTHSGAASDDELDDVEDLAEMTASEILMRSRLLEIKMPEAIVENVLAARDSDKLKKQQGGHCHSAPTASTRCSSIDLLILSRCRPGTRPRAHRGAELPE